MANKNKLAYGRDYTTLVGVLLAIIGVIPFVESTIILFLPPPPQYISSELYNWFCLVRIILVVWAIFSVFVYGKIIKFGNFGKLITLIINGIWFFAILSRAIILSNLPIITMIIMDIIIIGGGILSLQKQGWTGVVTANIIALISIGFYPVFFYNYIFIIVWCFFAMPILTIISLIFVALSRDKYGYLSRSELPNDFLKLLQFK